MSCQVSQVTALFLKCSWIQKSGQNFDWSQISAGFAIWENGWISATAGTGAKFSYSPNENTIIHHGLAIRSQFFLFFQFSFSQCISTYDISCWVSVWPVPWFSHPTGWFSGSLGGKIFGSHRLQFWVVLGLSAGFGLPQFFYGKYWFSIAKFRDIVIPHISLFYPI